MATSTYSARRKHNTVPSTKDMSNYGVTKETMELPNLHLAIEVLASIIINTTSHHQLVVINLVLIKKNKGNLLWNPASNCPYGTLKFSHTIKNLQAVNYTISGKVPEIYFLGYTWFLQYWYSRRNSFLVD